MLIGGDGFRGKLSKKFERSVHTSALVINGWLNISYEVNDLLWLVKK